MFLGLFHKENIKWTVSKNPRSIYMAIGGLLPFATGKYEYIKIANF